MCRVLRRDSRSHKTVFYGKNSEYHRELKNNINDVEKLAKQSTISKKYFKKTNT